tara:strand:- start:2714 stop:3286 length:573 start_codon:yes stop_codon:yes gene_type:complete
MSQKEKDLFLELLGTLEEDLRKTGFDPDSKPPGREPKIRGSVSDLDAPDLKRLYDEFLAFYDYITDQIATAVGFVMVSKARLEQVHAQALLSAHADTSLKNAEQRKATAVTDVTYVGAQKDYTYFRAKLAMQQERRDKYKRAMDRIGRELWLRTQDDGPNEFFKPAAKKSVEIVRPPISGGYKRREIDDP